MAAHHEPAAASYWKITVIVLAYFVVSISMVFVNKLLFSNTSYSINVPFFVTTFQVKKEGEKERTKE
jgi:hypothetical protein